MRKAQTLKVYSGDAIQNGKSLPVVVVARSQAMVIDALEAAGLGLNAGPDVKKSSLANVIRRHWSAADDLSAHTEAAATPGAVFTTGRGGRAVRIPCLPGRELPLRALKQRRLMPDANRRHESDAAKRERGERRLTAWLPPEASAALDKITSGDEERGAVTKAVAAALLAYAAQME